MPKPSAFEVFYKQEQQTPGNAVRLAVADARALGGLQEFVHQLKLAADHCDEREALLDALRTLTNLARHPLFPSTAELPAFAEAVEKARALLPIRQPSSPEIMVGRGAICTPARRKA